MDEVTFLRHLDNADKDLDSFPFWRVFKKACADNPIEGINKLTPGRQAVVILWEANNQFRGSDGILRSIPLDGENIEMYFNDTGSPALIKDPGDFDSIYVVMPMKG